MLTLTTFLISGCSFLGGVKELEIFTKEVERTPLNLEGPGPLELDDVKWTIVTESNYEKVFADLKKNNKNVAIVGLTDEGYETLSMNFARIRNYIILQGSVLQKYKNYYEGEKDGTEETADGK